ncbi:ABC transporter ATP-binding protein [Ampullimonas aquatilis]|uniref:ABC transporter ATP-binding protein n=1 Tax=Ampullimonas aquatilis TaxID=1341549 RepID=UPI003C74F542
MSLLTLNTVSVKYGAIEAVRKINLHVGEHEFVAIIGANGAGKTSTLKTVAGLIPNSEGVIQFQNKNINSTSAHTRQRSGLILVPEGRGVFRRMSTLDNLLMGAYVRGDSDAIQADIESMFVLFPRLKERAKQLAGSMSGGEQQMLALARALMGKPKLLLLDEPSMGLSPIMVQKIYEVILSVHQMGVAILLVEQNANLAMKIAGRVYVMESGDMVANGEPDELKNDGVIHQAYFG